MSEFEYKFNGAKLTELRDERPKSVMARKIGISPQLWHYYERGGFPSIPMLLRMRDLFNVEIEDFIVKVESQIKKAA